MARKTLEDLKKERNRLLLKQSKKLRYSSAKASLQSLAKARKLEERKLKAEIFAMKHPGSMAAKKSLKVTSGKLGKFLRKRAQIVKKNLDELA